MICTKKEASEFSEASFLFVLQGKDERSRNLRLRCGGIATAFSASGAIYFVLREGGVG